jgi:hypothetical protein
MNRSFASSPPGAVALAGELRRWIAAGLATAMVVAAALTAWRRAAGALSQPLDIGPLLAAGLFWCCAAAISRHSWPHAQFRARAAGEFRWLSGALTLAAGVFAASLSIGGTGVAGTTALWTALIAGEAVAWRPAMRRGGLRVPARPPAHPPERRHPGETHVPQAPAATALDAAPRRPLEPHAKAVAAALAPVGEELVQQLIRTQRADGRHTLRGVVRVAFSAGQRSATAHVAFCPPFAHNPQLEIDSAAGAEVRIKTAQIVPFGTRLDLKLAEPAAEPVTIDVRFSAVGEGGSHG